MSSIVEEPGTPSLTLRSIAEPHQWDQLEPQWQALFAASPQAAPPLHFTWLRNWWRCYDPPRPTGVHRLHIITMWQDSTLVGALPLYRRVARVPLLTRRCLCFLSTGEEEFEETCPDYLDLLCRPGCEASCLHALQTALHRAAWDYLDLSCMAASSPLVTDRSWLDGAVEVTPDAPCCLADLRGSWDDYLYRLSSKHRKNIRYCLRDTAAAGATLELATTADHPEFFADLIDLHQKRWQARAKPGCFAAPRFTEFHRTLAQVWIPTGQAVLARLRCAGEVQAVIYGFAHGSKFDAYQSGVTTARAGPLRSPGVSAHLLLMQKLVERGIERYDLLRGTSDYKNCLATTHIPMVRLQAWRPTVRAGIFRSCLHLGQALRHGVGHYPREMAGG